MLTEEEAGTKWCPLNRSAIAKRKPEGHPGTIVSGYVAFNRAYVGGTTDEMCVGNCIGSDCMAWRWFDSVSDDGKVCHPKPSVHVRRDPLPKEAPLTDRRGFCGAFGAPT